MEKWVTGMRWWCCVTVVNAAVVYEEYCRRRAGHGKPEGRKANPPERKATSTATEGEKGSGATTTVALVECKRSGLSIRSSLRHRSLRRHAPPRPFQQYPECERPGGELLVQPQPASDEVDAYREARCLRAGTCLGTQLSRFPEWTARNREPGASDGVPGTGYPDWQCQRVAILRPGAGKRCRAQVSAGGGKRREPM